MCTHQTLMGQHLQMYSPRFQIRCPSHAWHMQMEYHGNIAPPGQYKRRGVHSKCTCIVYACTCTCTLQNTECERRLRDGRKQMLWFLSHFYTTLKGKINVEEVEWYLHVHVHVHVYTTGINITNIFPKLHHPISTIYLLNLLKAQLIKLNRFSFNSS